MFIEIQWSVCSTIATLTTTECVAFRTLVLLIARLPRRRPSMCNASDRHCWETMWAVDENRNFPNHPHTVWFRALHSLDSDICARSAPAEVAVDREKTNRIYISYGANSMRCDIVSNLAKTDDRVPVKIINARTMRTNSPGIFIKWRIISEVLVGRIPSSYTNTEKWLRCATSRPTAEKSITSRSFYCAQLTVGQTILVRACARVCARANKARTQEKDRWKCTNYSK